MCNYEVVIHWSSEDDCFFCEEDALECLYKILVKETSK